MAGGFELNKHPLYECLPDDHSFCGDRDSGKLSDVILVFFSNPLASVITKAIKLHSRAAARYGSSLLVEEEANKDKHSSGRNEVRSDEGANLCPQCPVFSSI